MEASDKLIMVRSDEHQRMARGAWALGCAEGGASVIYRQIAHLLSAIARDEATGDVAWLEENRRKLKEVMDTAPSGSGWDDGTRLDEERSSPERLVFVGAFHHMDEHGTYDGWTAHEIIVTGSLRFGLEVKVTGRDRNGIKEYLGEMFHAWLTEGKESV